MSQSPPAASSATGSVTVPLRFVTNDEYVDSQNKQNYILRRELNLMREAQERTDDKLDSIGDRLDKTSESIDRKFESIDRRFESIDKRFESIDRKFDEFTARQDQFEAVFRNSRLSNPILPIRPVVTFDPVNGRRTPDSLHFPRNAGELYALREIDSPRKRQQLIYLANFYELVPSNDDYVVRNPLDTVARLEMVLGLEEDRFVRFRERAKQHADRPAQEPLKRTRTDYAELARQLAPLLCASLSNGVPSSPSVESHVGWDTTPLPAVKRPRLPWGPAEPATAVAAATLAPGAVDDQDAPMSAQPRLPSESTSAPPTEPTGFPSTVPMAHSDRGSTTNPNTSVRASSDGRTSP